jgi:uncharacterized membrane protein
MTHVDYAVEIDRHPDEVFALITDFSSTPFWNPQVITESISPPGSIGVGSLIHQKRKFMRATVEATSEITELEPNRRIASISIAGVSPKVSVKYDLEPMGEQTRLRFAITIEGGFFFRLVAPFVNRSLRKDVRERFERLKQLLEEQGV